MQMGIKYTLAIVFAGSLNLLTYGHEDEDSTYIIAELESIIEKTKPVNCVSKRSFRNISALDNDHILFVGTSRAWINRLATKCTSLHRRAKFTFDQSPNRVCKNSTFTSARPGDIGSQCRLGKFYKIEKRIAEQLKDAAQAGVFD